MLETREFSPRIKVPTTVFDTERDLPIRIPHVYDIEPDYNSHPGVQLGQTYEKECLKELAKQVDPNFVILGPNIIMKALDKSFFTRHSVPDALIFRPVPEGLSLTEISEFKHTRKKGTQRKVHNFGRLLGKIRTNPDLFNQKFQDAIEKTFYLPRLVIPDNDDIEFTIATPYNMHTTKLTLLDTKCRVFYFQVPLPIAS